MVPFARTGTGREWTEKLGLTENSFSETEKWCGSGNSIFERDSFSSSKLYSSRCYFFKQKNIAMMESPSSVNDKKYGSMRFQRAQTEIETKKKNLCWGFVK